MKLHHLAIQVFELERSRAFYTELLGLPELRRQPHSIWVEAGGLILMLERCAAEAAPPPWKSDQPGLHLIAFQMRAEERAGWKERLAAAGILLEAESDYTLYFRDPDGNRLGLSSYPERSRAPACL